ncbi:MAG: xylellain [Cyanobacteria bacterium RYN_339]|nr:xylellain [Cyanobacteria bacterium RYN_339]
MSKLRPSLLLLLALTGCGQALPAATQAPAGGLAVREADLPTTASGHKLGYDFQRGAGGDAPQELPRQGIIPPAVDLRSYCPPVYDQGDLGCCTAFAIAKGLRELQQRQRKETSTPLSALFFYYEERAPLRKTGQDTGATIADGMKVLLNEGCAPETDFPFQPARFTVKPAAAAYQHAGTWKVGKTYHLGSLDSVKTSLARGYAVAMGFECYSSFDKVGKDGWMAMPKAGEKKDGGHACVAVGYNDKAQCLIVRNSWGASWGDKGYFYMPYAYASSKAVDEYWAAW